MSRRIIRNYGADYARMSNEHPEWMELAATLLFMRDRCEEDDGPYNLQQAVAEGLMLAWKMGKEGKTPPMPATAAHRRYVAREPDEELCTIHTALTLLAWSPKAGTPAPPGLMASRLRKLGAVKPASQPKLIRRRK